MVVRPKVKLKPELIGAVMTRSRDFFTAASGRPTMTMMVSPYPAFTSTSTGYASMPFTAAEQTLANVGRVMGQTGSKGNPVFRAVRKIVSADRHPRTACRSRWGGRTPARSCAKTGVGGATSKTDGGVGAPDPRLILAGGAKDV